MGRLIRGVNDLLTVNPKLASEWNYEKNGDLKPTDITASSGKKVWWLLPYDDSNTGKHFNFEWEAKICNRNNGNDCPYLKGKTVWQGFNDLATTNPELAKQWHPTKNGKLKPSDVMANSNKKVWWLLPYDNSVTGKHFDFEWTATIIERNRGTGCPYFNGTAIWQGFNDLETVNPELAKQWHPTKNGNLKPIDVTANSNKIVWWLLPYNDSITGKHFNFEWEAPIYSRNQGIGCPYLSNQKVFQGFNDLETVNPELAKQWHPTKNGSLKPTEVAIGSHKNVWWLYPYDDPVTGQHFDFEWQAIIASRNDTDDCPYLSSNPRVWQGFNDLATINPELAKQWHPTKNGNLKPTDVTANSSKKVWWYLPYDDEKTGKHFDFEWKATILERNKGTGCPFLNGVVWQGFNDLATINPELAKQWHPTKNGNLKPTDVTTSSIKKVWWLYPYEDLITGKHFDFEWTATIAERNKGNGCPYLSPNPRAWQGFNDLATINPELAKQWHPTKNGNLKLTDVTANSSKKVWWYLSYDDEKTGKHFDFEWKATIAERNRGNGCPFLTGKKVWQGFNDLVTVNPKLASQWHPTKNGNLKPENVTAGSQEKVWWLLSYDNPITGKHFDFEWLAKIDNRSQGTGCPFFNGTAVWIGFNDLATVNPELAKQWHPTKNGNLKPTDVTANSNKKVWWLLSYDNPKTGEHFDFEWQAQIGNRNHGAGCPFLTPSRTEELIYNFLKKENIIFKAEEPLNCRDKYPLPFDIFLQSKNLIIECDGIQHFKSIDYFGGKKDFKIRKLHDNIKNNFCKENNIPILRIPYTYDSILDKQKIESLVMEFIKTKTVPQEILNFYSQHKFSNYIECVKELNEKNKRVV